MTTPTPIVSTLPNDTLYPSVSALRTSQTYTGTKLDTATANYKSWLQDILLFLTLTGLKGYVKGEIPKPGDDEPRAKRNWQQNDEAATAIVISIVEHGEREYLDLEKGANACWKTLEERHKKGRKRLLENPRRASQK
jgi:hypothetical protein